MAPVVVWPKRKKILEKMLLAGPKAPIRITATMTLVTLPSRIAEKARSKPSRTEPSMVLPERISSRMRSAVMMLASTPIPILRIIPAIPGRVRVKEGTSGSSRVTDATIITICPVRAKSPTKPGRRYFSTM